MKDRAMQALYLLALEPIAESTADENSYGFRPYRSTADAIVQVKNVLSRAHSSRWVLDADIKGCFDNISHDWLLAHIPMEKRVLRRWLKAGVVEMGRLNPTDAGTPQGGIISPVLANMTLDGLEKLLTERFKSRQHKVHLVRYADDFIVTGSSKELLETKVRPVIEEFLAQRGLWLSPTKTRITHVEDGFRLPGVACAMAQRWPAHMSVEKEPTDALRQSPKDDSSASRRKAGRPDSEAQPDSEGMGPVPQAGRGK
jgi:RNA-directed DNA polymerase